MSSIFQALQDTANEHCQLLLAGRDDLALKGLTWVLFKIDLQIDRYPILGETVTVRTFTKGSSFKFFPRYYVVEDISGHQLCRAGSLWILMDRETRRTVTSKEFGMKLPNVTEIEIPIRISTASSKIVGNEIIGTYKPLYTDIDFNGHVNNIRYVDWLCNSLGLNTMTDREITFVSVGYNYEVHPDIELVTKLICDGNAFQFSGAYDGKTYFNINGIMRKRQK